MSQFCFSYSGPYNRFDANDAYALDKKESIRTKLTHQKSACLASIKQHADSLRGTLNFVNQEYNCSGVRVVLDVNLRQKLCSHGLFIKDQVDFAQNILFEPFVHFWANNTVNKISIGAFSYLNNSNQVCNACIGRYCSIAYDCDIGIMTHCVHAPSTSPALYNPEGFGFAKYKHRSLPKWHEHDYESYNEVNIGNDVWIGSHVIIPSNVTIGHGAIIGAGAVITKDVPPYAVVVGHNRFVKQRFRDEIVADLLELQWWNFNIPALLTLPKNKTNLKQLSSTHPLIESDFFLRNNSVEEFIADLKYLRSIMYDTKEINSKAPDLWQDFILTDNYHALNIINSNTAQLFAVQNIVNEFNQAH